jgi:hypothetical protein
MVNQANFRPPPNSGMESMFANPFGMPQQDYAPQMSTRTSAGYPPTMNGASFQKENRPGYNDYMLGR